MAVSKSAPRKKSVVRFSGKIFISYRRGDSASTTGRIYDWLASRHSKKDIFFDIESVEYGTDFEQRIQQSIPQSRVVLAIIGPHWLDDGVGPSKYVRSELELALTKGIPIIPVLVDGTTMPAPEQLPASLQSLSRVNAAEVRPGKDFQHDMELLAKPLGIPLVPRAQRILRSPGFWMLTGSAVALLALAIVGLLSGFPGTSTDPRVAATATAAVRQATETARAEQAAADATATGNVVHAEQTRVSATATAQVLAPFTYHADSPGQGCASNGTWTYVPGNPNYAPSMTCVSGGTRLRDGEITFGGASGFTFPSTFSVSVDVSDLSSTCTSLAVNTPELGVHMLVYCDGGFWYEYYHDNTCDVCALNQEQTGTVPESNHYRLTITFAETTTLYLINGQQVYVRDGVTVQPKSISLATAPPQPPYPPLGGTGSGVTLSNFDIVPQP
jgi:hypothetical protein